ncbi:hypothetical protein CPB84DRAFT_1780501 [Gymnopilus junonius]|uniref:Uncharacterized protein n=1 Tax=Gymnopilus junonius TaxID=109634 RepID=A0A9P5NJS2_GYMJU|nr:hypothetical protein CPB84DRAFT_1780501 [Gymnopilus junonius]
MRRLCSAIHVVAIFLTCGMESSFMAASITIASQGTYLSLGRKMYFLPQRHGSWFWAGS